MKFVVALAMGFLSGLMIYFMAGLLFMDQPSAGAPSAVLVVGWLVGGWIASTWILLRGAVTVSRVFSRGFLLGAAEWLTMILVGVVFAGKALSAADPTSDAEIAGAAVGGGMVALLTGGLSLVMAVICLIGFAVSHSLGKEMRKEIPASTTMRKCPSCAELIQAEAIKCRYCGEQLESIRP